MASVVERLRDAVNEHDIEALLECIDDDYRSEQPAHPNRGFGGKEQVRKNWSAIFESFPDFEAELPRHTSDGGTVWSEWHWSATGLDIAGVTLFGVREDRIVWGRLYMEEVEEGGEDIDAAVRSMTEGGQRGGADRT
ncbi:MAG: nuclear transport factor 2 family protein [Rubrobacteraceae bacterium]